MPRVAAHLIALLLSTAFVLAGCLEQPQGGNETDSPTDNETPSETEDSEGDPDEEIPEEEKECYDYIPPRAVPPKEQKVDSKDDIRCAGQYTITNEGSGKSWSVPEWEVDDWWHYESKAVVGGTACKQENRSVQDTTGKMFGLDIYTMEVEPLDCDGEPEPDEDPFERNRTQKDLMKIHDDGYVDHQVFFPLREGKSWVYMDSIGRMIEVSGVSHEENYLHPEMGLVEAWKWEWNTSTEDSEMDVEEVWGVQARNLIDRETTIEFNGYVITTQETLLDSSYGDGGLLGRVFT